MFSRKDSQFSSKAEEPKTEKSQLLSVSTVSDGEPQPETTRTERLRTRRVNGMKVALRDVEITRGPKGQFVRRLKDILRKTHTSSKKPPIDIDAYEPAIHLAPQRSSMPLRHDVHDQSDDED